MATLVFDIQGVLCQIPASISGKGWNSTTGRRTIELIEFDFRDNIFSIVERDNAWLMLVFYLSSKMFLGYITTFFLSVAMCMAAEHRGSQDRNLAVCRNTAGYDTVDHGCMKDPPVCVNSRGQYVLELFKCWFVFTLCENTS